MNDLVERRSLSSSYPLYKLTPSHAADEKDIANNTCIPCIQQYVQIVLVIRAESNSVKMVLRLGGVGCQTIPGPLPPSLLKARSLGFDKN